MDWSSVLAGILLFWPACIVLFFIGFCCIVFAVVLVGSATVLFGIFLYGLYSILRDLGLLDAIFAKIGKISNYVSDHVKKNVKESFLFQKNKQIEEKGPALFICHPHGLYGLTWFIHFAIGFSDWPLSERPALAVHSIFFQIPILRELFVQHNCIEAKEEVIRETLKKGTSVALLVGGIEELLLTQSGTMNLVLKKRNGFARIAQEMKVPLIPLVSPNENDLFSTFETPTWKWIQGQIYKQLGLAIPLPSLQNLLSWCSLAYKPFEKPVMTHMLNPVYPESKTIEVLKSEYCGNLIKFSKKSGISITLSK